MTSDFQSLLPRNATSQERALECAMRPGDGVRDAVTLVRTAKEVLPDGWPQFLVWEYGLEELLPYLPDPRVVLVTGLQWQRIKGTPASLRVALEWIGFDEAIVEQETPTGRHWFEYQVDPGRIPASRAELVNIVGLARLSAPVGTRLSRLFHGYDLRRAIYDYTSWSDGTLYSDHSGVYDPELGVDLSFGRTISLVAEVGDVVVKGFRTLILTRITRYEDRQLWDFVGWGDGPPLRNYKASVNTDTAAAVEADIDEPQPDPRVVTRTMAKDEYGWGESNWGPRKWTDPASIVG